MENLTRPAVTSLVNDIRDAAASAEGGLSAAEQTTIQNLINGQIGALEGSLQTELGKGTGPIIGRIDQMLSSLEQLADTIETLDPAVVEDVLVALIELAGSDASGVQMVFADVEEARSYIVDNLIILIDM